MHGKQVRKTQMCKKRLPARVHSTPPSPSTRRARHGRNSVFQCERGGPLQKCKTPDPPKVLGRVLGEVSARNGVLREVLVLLVSRGDTRGSTFPSTSPSTPFLASTSPSTLPSTFRGSGVLRFCRGPPRSEVFHKSPAQKVGTMLGKSSIPWKLNHLVIQNRLSS